MSEPDNRQNPTQRALHSRMAAHLSWARTPDRTARTAPARDGLRKRFEREVLAQAVEAGEIPAGGTLAPAELALRADSLRKAHFTGMALKSAEARRKRKPPTPRGGTVPTEERSLDERDR